jgi:cellulose synthase (UDP-forming)
MSFSPQPTSRIQRFVLLSVGLSLVLTGLLVVLTVFKAPSFSAFLGYFTPKLSPWLFVRPFWPETSLFLPFAQQLWLSAGLVLAYVMVGVFKPQWRTVFIALSLLMVARAVLWRGVETLHFYAPVSQWVGYALFGAECLALLSLALGCIQLFKPTNRAKHPVPLAANQPLPTVDVLVCTYNEPLWVLYRTLVGCQALAYPNKTVYLLDDGRRPQMEQLAKHLGVRYLSRAFNTHAKAGNLNNALQHSSGELALILDADHVPSQHTLNELMGFFQKDEGLAFVQTPQHFCTLDPFQRNLLASHVLSNEQDFFFHSVQPGNDYWNACFFAGTGAVFRRKALQAIGGFATETITEDTHTGLRLHAQGWRSAFYNKNLIAGLAQDSFGDFIKQRARWARGMAQILAYDHPFNTKGLSWGQKVCYFGGIAYFFSGLVKSVFLLAPLAFLLFGVMTINAGLLEMLTYYIPCFMALYWGYTVLTHGNRHLFWGEIYDSALFFYTSLSALSGLLFPKAGRFQVTPKGTVSHAAPFQWALVWPQLGLALLTSVGLVSAGLRAYQNPLFLGGLFTNYFWGLYNLVLLLGALYVAQERPQQRLYPRIARTLPCELKLLDGSLALGEVQDLSESGFSVQFKEPIPVAGTMALRVKDWELNEVSSFSVQVVRSHVHATTQSHTLGLCLVNRTDAQHQALVRHMFGSATVWNQQRQAAQAVPWHEALLVMLATTFRMNQSAERPFWRRTPRFGVNLTGSLLVNEQSPPVPISTLELSESGVAFKAPKTVSLKKGQQAKLQLCWSNGRQSYLLIEVKRQGYLSLQHKRFGCNFLQLSRQERIELIQQIYGVQEGLVRVASTVNVALPCRMELPAALNVPPQQGVTRELSEVGLCVELPRPLPLSPNGALSGRITLQWPNGKESLMPVSIYPGLSATQYLLYFEGLSLAQLDDISRQLYDPSVISLNTVRA